MSVAPNNEERRGIEEVRRLPPKSAVSGMSASDLSLKLLTHLLAASETAIEVVHGVGVVSTDEVQTLAQLDGVL